MIWVTALICATVLALAGMAYRFFMRGRETRLEDHTEVLKNHARVLAKHEEILVKLERSTTRKALGA